MFQVTCGSGLRDKLSAFITGLRKNATPVFIFSLLVLMAVLAQPAWAQVDSRPTDSGAIANSTEGNVSSDREHKDVKVPNVLGLWRDEAILDLFKAGLRIGDIRDETSHSVADHHVISESPTAGTEAKAGSKVDLVIARAPDVKVPDVAGLTLSAAKAALAKVDLKVGRIEEKISATVAAGFIISQHPRAGTTVREDRRVRLEVSKGASHDTVPNVVGVTKAAATAAITDAGLTVGTITMQSSATVAMGVVISQSPSAGSSVAPKSPVNLVVSSGIAKVAVPNVVGLTQTAAMSAITGAGLVVGGVSMQSSTTVAAGLVISETPVAGTSVASGSAVNLAISSGLPKVAVPNVVGLTQAAATTTITEAGLKVGAVTMQSSATVAAGLVISESPGAGTAVVSGSAVNFVVSSGASSTLLPPTGLVVTPGNGELSLSWNRSAGATSYSVYQSSTPGATQGSLAQSGITSTTVKLTNLTNSHFYYLYVVASNGTATSGPSTVVVGVPQAPLSAAATLATGIVVLTDSQLAQIVTESGSSVVFNGQIQLPVGTVFITEKNALVADSVAVANGQTTISGHAPRLDQLFRSLTIKGTVVFDASTVTPAATVATQQLAGIAHPEASGSGSANLSYTFPINFSPGGGFTTTGSVIATLAADVDFDFSNGTLNSAQVIISQTNDASLLSKFSAKTSFSDDVSLGSYYYPIPVSVVDAGLSLVGVRVAGIYVPVSVLLGATIQFGASLSLDASSQASMTVNSTNGSISTPTLTFDGTIGASVDAGSVNSLGAPEFASLSVTDSAYLHVRPALSFLNTVALAGLDLQAGPADTATLEVVRGTPPFCLEVSAALNAQASAFFKTVGVNLESNAVSYSLPIPPLPGIGSCLLPVTLKASVDPSTEPASYFSSILLDVNVSPASSPPAGTPSPSGTVDIEMNGQSCTATLNANGTGQCSLLASPGGQGMPLDASYSGDSHYNPAMTSIAVNVNKAPTAITTLYPASVPAESSVSLAAHVVPNPALPTGAVAPTGNVEIVDSSGNVLCEFDLADSGNGTGACQAIFSTPGLKSITTSYSGDSNYQPSQIVSTITVCGDVACKLPGKWEAVTNGAYSSAYWIINADGTATWEYFGQASPCYNTPLPASVALGTNSFTATVLLGTDTAPFPCQETDTYQMSLDSNGLIAQGTVNINSLGNQPFTLPSTWTKASGSQIVVPSPTFYDQVATTRMFTFAGLNLKVTSEVTTTVSPGTILSENPAGGSIVAPGSTVSIVVAVAPPNQ